MKKTFYVTTPIYYPSGSLHIGHCYTTFMADSIASYKKACGYDVYFLTGTDEHGQKIQTKAQEMGVSPIEYVDKMASEIQALWKDLQITNDGFIRTTDPKHMELVQKTFSKFLKNGDIYLGTYEGWYCKPCEAFFTETQLVDGKCPDCGREVSKEKEEAYFFKMSKYTNRLLDFYNNNPQTVTPSSRLNEVVTNFIRPGLEDLCISRTSFSWGVPVKENPKHVVYVWLDALLNYISALGYDSDDDSLYKKFWENCNEKIHLLGKEITRFHLIYWPVFLMALDLPLPDKFLVHGWVVMKDGKMSKSKGNVIYPQKLKELYGMDMLRYYLLREIPFCEDGMFTPEQFVERINSDLANDYGNLTHRTLSMVNKYYNGKVPAYKGCVSEFDRDFENLIRNNINFFFDKMDAYRINDAIATCFEIISAANKYIDDTKPWALAKDESKADELASVMNHLINAIYASSVLLSPFLKEGTSKIFAMLNCPSELISYEIIKENYIQINDMVITSTPTPVYVRLDPNVEIERMKENIYKL